MPAEVNKVTEDEEVPTPFITAVMSEPTGEPIEGVTERMTGIRVIPVDVN